MTPLARHRLLSLLLATALVATLGVALTDDDARALDGPVDVVYVATGRNFPDALAGSTLAVSGNAPLLTVEARLPIPAATVAALEALDPDRVVVFGGPVAVGDDVVDALAAYARSGQVTRIAGGDRHDTAAQIAEALPDKVADADHLDGLDATDFLRADGTASDSDALGGMPADDYLTDADALDADTVDGRDAADLRVLNLGNWTYVAGPADTTGLLGPRLPDGDVSGVGATVIVPPGYVTGEPLSVDLLVQEDDFSACTLVLTTQGTMTSPGDSGSTFVDWIAEGNDSRELRLDTASGTDNHLLRFDFTQVDVTEPGTALTFVVYRQGDEGADSCTSSLSVAGAQLLY